MNASAASSESQYSCLPPSTDDPIYDEWVPLKQD